MPNKIPLDRCVGPTGLLSMALTAITMIGACSDHASRSVMTNAGGIPGALGGDTANSSPDNSGDSAALPSDGSAVRGGTTGRKSTKSASGGTSFASIASTEGTGGSDDNGTNQGRGGTLGSSTSANATRGGTKQSMNSSTTRASGAQGGGSNKTGTTTTRNTIPTGGSGGRLQGDGGATLLTGGGTGASRDTRALGGTSPGSTTVRSSSWKIMPLGDSITGTTCYPQLLSETLKVAGHDNFEFVGSITNNQSCNGAPFVKSEGHGGYLVTYLLNDSHASEKKGTLTELKTWSNTKPEVIFMHFGTNDVWSNIATANIISAYTTVIDTFRSTSPNVIVFVAQIIPMNPSPTCSTCASGIAALNQQITGWASNKSTDNSPIYVVDLNTGFTADSTNTADGVHPNPTGAQKMADKMAAALFAKLPSL